MDKFQGEALPGSGDAPTPCAFLRVISNKISESPYWEALYVLDLRMIHHVRTVLRLPRALDSKKGRKALKCDLTSILSLNNHLTRSERGSNISL